MTTQQSMEFPKINFVALVAGVLFLVSLFLYWWGIDGTGSFFGAATSESFRWSLWSGPSNTSIASAQSFQTLVTYSPVIGALVTVSTVLLLIGTIPKAQRLLYPGLLLSIATPIVYAVLVNYSVSNACSGSTNCISGPFGTQTMSAGPVSLTLNWGFQPGFYLEIGGLILSIIAIAFHRTYLTTKKS